MRTRPSARRLLVLVGLVAFVAAAGSIPARATVGARLSADEPYYLLTAQSLAEDRSLDVSDELRDRAYAPYHEVQIDEQTVLVDRAVDMAVDRAVDGVGDGRRVSPHDPLLPVVLALPMALGGWAAAKLTLALFAAVAAALTAWIAIERFGVGQPTAAVVTAACFVGVPLAPYGAQVYPELPAACAVLAGFAALTARERSWATTLVGVLAVVALPWLSVKYVPVAGVLALGLLAGNRSRRSAGLVLAALGVAAVAYLLAHQRWYGGWTVYAAGDHFAASGEFSVVGRQVDVLGRSRRIIGLFVDRDFGLVAWSPVWLAAPVAIGWMAARRPRGAVALLGLVAAGWSTATFVALTMHGWWVPGRQVVVVTPLLVVAICVVVDEVPWGRTGLRQLAIGLAGVVGAVTWGHLVWEASTGRRTLIVDFAETAAPWHRMVGFVLPDGLRGGPAADAGLAAWMAIALVAVGLSARAGRRASSSGSEVAHTAQGERGHEDGQPRERQETGPHL